MLARGGKVMVRAWTGKSEKGRVRRRASASVSVWKGIVAGRGVRAGCGVIRSGGLTLGMLIR